MKVVPDTPEASITRPMIDESEVMSTKPMSVVPDATGTSDLTQMFVVPDTNVAIKDSEVSADVDSMDMSNSELDVDAFIAQEKHRILQSHTTEFGLIKPDKNLPQTVGFWESMGFGRNVDASVKAMRGETEVESLMGELYNLEKKNPEVMLSVKGEEFRQEMEQRIDTALKAPDLDFTEIAGHLVTLAQDNPSLLADIIIDETYANPVLTLFSAGAFLIGGPFGTALGSATQLRRVIDLMKLGSARQKLAAFTLEKVLARGAGVAATEAAVAGADQYGRNASVGRDRFQNILSASETGAAVGFTMNMLVSAGSIGWGRSLSHATNFDEVFMQMQKETGASTSELIQTFNETLGKLPSKDDVRRVMETKLDLTIEGVEPFVPTQRRQLTDTDVFNVSGKLDGEFGPNTHTTRPIGMDAAGEIFYNAKNIVNDLRTGFGHMFGKKQDGKLGTSPDAIIRSKAFANLDPRSFAKFMAEGESPKRYAEFLMRLEQNRKKILNEGTDLDPSSVYRQAAEDATAQMGGKYTSLLKRNIKQRTFDNIKAGTTHAGATVSEFLKDPPKMWEGLKDLYMGPAEYVRDVVRGPTEFVRDVVRGPKEGYDTALVYRNKTAGLLRNREGDIATGELEIDRVVRWVKSEVKSPKRREAISHYLEGNIDEYNFYLRANNLDEIQLTPREIKVASVARQFMDDVFDMAQKSELLMGFVKNKPAYKKFRDKMGKDTSLVDAMLIPVRYVEDVGSPGRLAKLSTDGTVLLRKGVTKPEILDYFTKGTGEGAPQMVAMRNYMRDAYKIDLLDEIRKMSDDDAIRFLVAHEKGIATQKKTYGKQFNYTGTSGKRGISKKYGLDDPKNPRLTDRAIKVEADAAKFGLKHLDDSKKLNDEVWSTVKDIPDPRAFAGANLKSAKLPNRGNYVTHLTSHKVAPTEQDLLNLSLDDAHRASTINVRSRFMKARKYDTLLDAIYAGEKIYSQDIATLLSTYGRSMVRAQLNNRVVNYLTNMRTLNGHRMMGRKQDVPDYYVKFTHPNFKGPDGEFLHVNPNVAPDLRLYFDTSEPGVMNRVIQNIVLIVKRSALGMSFFHVAALAWSGANAGLSPKDIFQNIVPFMKSKGRYALAGQEGYDEMIAGMRNTLKVGAAEDLKGDTLINAMRGIASFTERKINNITHFKPSGKLVVAPLRTVARSQEIIDTYLWTYVNPGLKVTTYLAKINKLRLADARRAHKTGTPVTDLDLLRQRAAQFTNDAFGAQNWEQMAMNVRSHMGHRIGAALNKSSTRGFIRMLVFSPDWCSVSTTRAMTKVGWKYHHELTVGDEILAFNKETNTYEWNVLNDMYVNEDYDNTIVRVNNRNHSIGITPHHTCIVNNKTTGQRDIVEAKDLQTNHTIPRSVNYDLPVKETYDLDFIKLVGWLATDGYIKKCNQKLADGSIKLYQYGRIVQCKPPTVQILKDMGLTYYTEKLGRNDHGAFKDNYVKHVFKIPNDQFKKMQELKVDRRLNHEFLNRLTRPQLQVLLDTMDLADGRGQNRICAGTESKIFYITMIRIMLGQSCTFAHEAKTTWNSREVKSDSISCHNKSLVNYKGTVWCPSVDTGFWVAEESGLIFITGNSLSNLRVIGKSADPTDKAHGLYVGYAIRSAMLFAMVGEILQQTAGEGSIFDDDLNDALRPDIGGGQHIEFSKQLTEVIRLFTEGPLRFAKNKSSSLVKSTRHMDSWDDFFDFWMDAPQPIGAKQLIETGSPAGILGMPISEKYD